MTIWVFLSQCLSEDHSCRQAVAGLLAWRLARRLRPCSAKIGAYCTARDSVPEEACARLLSQTGREADEEAPSMWRWLGHRVLVVDGSTITMPDTPENQAKYPQIPGQKPGCGFPIARIVVVFSLAVGTVLSAALGKYQGKQTGENSLFRTLHGLLAADDVVLADRYFSGWFDIALEWLSAAEYAALPADLTLRETRVRVADPRCRTRVLVIVTSLLDADKNSAAALAEPYRRRWQAELNLRSLKIVLQLDHLRCKTPHRVRNEFLMHLVAYNLIRKLQAIAAAGSGRQPWMISFKGALQTLDQLLPLLATTIATNAWCDALLEALAAHQVGHRPNRHEPRVKKRRPKSYKLMTKPRHEYKTHTATTC